MRKWNMLMICMLAIALKSSGQNHLVLEGTIGKSPIVMMIEKEKGNVYVTYFNKNSPHDKELAGEETKSGEIIVRIAEFDDDRNKDTVYESLQIHEIGKQTKWKGTWRDHEGNQLPVQLTVLKTQDYFETKKSYFKYLNDSITYEGKIKIQWNHEIESNIVSFQILNGYPDSILNKINRILQKKQLENINNYYTCNGRHYDYGDFDYRIDGLFISDGIISVDAGASWYCGGVHPDSGEMCFTINTNTGKEIEDLDDIFDFKAPQSEPLADTLKYNERGENIIRLLSKLYPKEMAIPDSTSDDCNYSQPYDWNYPGWYFTKKGFQLVPSFPHALQACGGAGFAIIPYSILEQYLIKEKQISLPK